MKLAVWYLKDTERFDESLIWNIYFLLLLLLYYYCYQYYYYYCYYYYIIISLCWFLAYIYSNVESTFFALSSLEIFL